MGREYDRGGHGWQPTRQIVRILFAEDDASFGIAVRKTLIRRGYAVDWVKEGRHFDQSLATHRYDIVVLDLGLPDTSGETLLRSLRARRENLPVIVITARGGIQDRIALLDLGADDYLVKPFDLEELMARIRCVLRRAATDDGGEGALCVGPLRLYPERMAVTWNGRAVAFTAREFCVLETLVRRRNHVVSRGQLEEALYGWGEEVDSNTVEVYVHYVRRKLGPELIHTVRGVGYQLAALREHA